MRISSRLVVFVMGLVFSGAMARAGDLLTLEQTAIFPEAKAKELIETVCYDAPRSTGYWTPAARDLAGIEETLVEFLRANRITREMDWKNFRRQVVGIKRGDDRLIFIYYFRFIQRTGAGAEVENEAWRKKPWLVYDGGSSFFRVLYDVKTKKFVWYECNGVA